MNIADLRKIIYEEVVKAMREELRDILVEAVEAVKDQPQQYLEEQAPALETYIGFKPEKTKPGTKSITNILQETAQTMGKDDYRNLLGGEQPVVTESARPGNMAGMPSFIATAAAKAKAVLDKSNEKDRKRNAL